MNAGTRQLPRLDVVIGNNFGHLPMFVGAEKGIFKNHGIGAHMKVVDTGTDMVNAMHNGEAQIGDMSVTTFLKAVHSGEPFKVIGIIMNDATRDNADEPLGIVTRKGKGINVGKVADLKGKRIGLARGQTSDEYFKMVLRRAGIVLQRTFHTCTRACVMGSYISNRNACAQTWNLFNDDRRTLPKNWTRMSRSNLSRNALVPANA